MFHSSGFFSGTLCPFYEHGLCHRPYCHYRHSRRERSAPRKRPQLKTKYTNFHNDSPTTTEESTSEPSRTVNEGENKETPPGPSKTEETAVFNFYGAKESEAAPAVEEENGPVEESGTDNRTDKIVSTQPGAEVELPCYAPEVCVETVVGVEHDEISEKEVKDLLPPYEVQMVTVEVTDVPMETDDAPPTNDDITEADIFGGSADEEMVSPDDISREEKEDGGGGGGGVETQNMEMEKQEEEEGEGDSGTKREEDEEVCPENEDVKAEFQQAIETQSSASGSRKRPKSLADYPSTVQKKRRIALPNAEDYRQNTSKSAIKRTPTTTSNFAAALDKDSLYMGRKRLALTVKPISSDKHSTAPARPTIPLKANSKVPTKLRQKFLDSYIDEILKVTFDPKQAYERGEKEESELFEKCSSRMSYCNKASQTLQRLRKEAKEFIENQRKVSDARVKAHQDNRRGLESKTTPTNNQSKKNVTLTERRQKMKKMKNDDISSASVHSPTSLSPRLVERCKSVEVRVRRCSVGVSGSEEERGPDGDSVSTVSASSFYSPTVNTSNPSEMAGNVSEKKKKKVEKLKKMKTNSSKETKKTPNNLKETQKLSSSPSVPTTTTRTAPIVISDVEERGGGGGGGGVGRDKSIVSLKKDLFGDSDSDCVVLSSPCTSGEEEIMNISFEDALKGPKLNKMKQRKRAGKMMRKPIQKSKLLKKDEEGERERVAGGRKERLGSGEKKEETRVERRNKPRRRSSTNAIDEPPANFKPDSDSLVNLSHVAAKAYTPSTSLSSLRLSKPATKPLPTPPPPHPLPPSSSSSKPSFCIVKKPKVTLTASNFYSSMKNYVMSEDQLVENGYPRPTSREGVAAVNWGTTSTPIIQPVGPNAMRHNCSRCGKSFIIYNDGQYQTVEDCVHHYARPYKVRDCAEGMVLEYSCCGGRSGSVGCHVAKFHVTAGEKPGEIPGYVQTSSSSTTSTSFSSTTSTTSSTTSSTSSSSSSMETVYALDCEMCYTTAGLELTRVSVVDMDLKPVYESIVLPSRPIVDYNTRFSGLTADDFRSVSTTITDVQREILSFVTSDTVLLGHSLESDLRSLKIIHNTVVDTAIVFPHRRGPPLKRALKSLMKDHLNKIIQNNIDDGHDSSEDAKACMELMIMKIKEDLQKSTRSSTI